MKRVIILLSFVFAFVGFASADNIFSDGFESGSLSGWALSSAWNGTNWTASINDSYQGVWHAESNPRDTHVEVSNMQRVVSTVDYENINFSYYRKLIGLDSSDEFKVKWFDGNNWIILEDINNETNLEYIFRSFNLPVNATNNSNFAIRFECSANAANEYCRVDDVLIEGNPTISSGNVTNVYYGYFNYMSGYDYFVIVNHTSNVISFSGLNASNQNEYYSFPFNFLANFVTRINYVWFYGWFDNHNLYINQYIQTGNNYYSLANETSSGVYDGQFVLNNSYLPQVVVNVSIDTNYNISTFAPIGYSGLITLAPIDSSWNAGAHVYNPFLFQTKLIQNNSQNYIETEMWIKEDLDSYGLNPTWTAPLYSI